MSGTIVVVATDFIITATLVQPANGIRQLSVYRSVLVRPDDVQYQPVAEVLTNHCSLLSSQAELEDESMMFGIAVEEEYDIWQICPGQDIPHNCVQANLEVPALAS